MTVSHAVAQQSSAGYEVFAHVARLSTTGMISRVQTADQIEAGAAIDAILRAGGMARRLQGGIGLHDAEKRVSADQVRIFNLLLEARGIDAALELVERETAHTFLLTGGSGEEARTIDIGPDLQAWAENPLHISILEQLGTTLQELGQDERFEAPVAFATEAADGQQQAPATISSTCTVGPEGCTLQSTCTTDNCTSGSCTGATGCTQDSCTAGACTSGGQCTVGDGCTKGSDCTAGKNCTGSSSCTQGDKCTRGGNCTGNNSCTSSAEACTSGSYCTSSSGRVCTLGPACTSGSECTGGDNCSGGAHCTSGSGGCTSGNTCTNGSFCSLGSNCTSGPRGCTQNSCSDAAACTTGTCSTATKCTDGTACSSDPYPCQATWAPNCTYVSGCTAGGGCPVEGMGNEGLSFKAGQSIDQLALGSLKQVKTFMTSGTQTASVAWMGILLLGFAPLTRFKSRAC